MKSTVVLMIAIAASLPAFARGGDHSSVGIAPTHLVMDRDSISGCTKSKGTHFALSHATNPNGTKARGLL